MPQVGIYIDANTGNLGIGTTSPIVPLHVNGIAKASTLSGIGQGFAYMEVLTSGTSWTVPANVYRIKVTLVGGGGGSGGAVGTTSGANGSAGGGGGGGAVCIGFYTVVPGQAMTYAIGSGGTAGGSGGVTPGGDGGTTTTTYGGVTFTAGGGVGGNGSDGGASGGAGGTASGGTLNLSGGRGSEGINTNNTNSQLIIPMGGSTALGFGWSGHFDRNALGGNGNGYGGGASGARVTTSTDRAGGVGASGVVIVEY